jgi:hypothetical protein
MGNFCRLIWCGLIGLFRSRAALEAEILMLRHQLNVLRRIAWPTGFQQHRSVRVGVAEHFFYCFFGSPTGFLDIDARYIACGRDEYRFWSLDASGDSLLNDCGFSIKSMDSTGYFLNEPVGHVGNDIKKGVDFIL